MSRFRSAPVRAAVAGLALVSVASLTACGGGGEDQAEAALPSKIRQVKEVSVSKDFLGLRVKREQVNDLLGAVKRPYVEATSLYSMRTPDNQGEDELQATLQISRFADEADYKSSQFRSAIVNLIGKSTVQQYRMGNRAIFLTTGEKQSLAIWFEDEYLFVLATRDAYKAPRALLRKAMEIRP